MHTSHGDRAGVYSHTLGLPTSVTPKYRIDPFQNKVNIWGLNGHMDHISSPLYRARETGYDIWVYGIVDYYKYLYYKKQLLVCKFVTHAKESCATNI